MASLGWTLTPEPGPVDEEMTLSPCNGTTMKTSLTIDEANLKIMTSHTPVLSCIIFNQDEDYKISYIVILYDYNKKNKTRDVCCCIFISL